MPEGVVLREKRGPAHTRPDLSDGRYTQSDSAGGRTGTVPMPIGVYRVGLHNGTTWRCGLT